MTRGRDSSTFEACSRKFTGSCAHHGVTSSLTVMQIYDSISLLEEEILTALSSPSTLVSQINQLKFNDVSDEFAKEDIFSTSPESNVCRTLCDSFSFFADSSRKRMSWMRPWSKRCISPTSPTLRNRLCKALSTRVPAVPRSNRSMRSHCISAWRCSLHCAHDSCGAKRRDSIRLCH